jgi:transcriptional regulator with PAS, ATPase and Fis domain
LDEQAKNILLKYPWPGNIRELKNLIEQLSVLSEDKMIDAETILQIAPHLTKTNLPALTKGSDGLQEREILYKLLFDMKGDLHDLKQLVFELIRGNNLRVPETASFRAFNTPSSEADFMATENWERNSIPEIMAQPGSPERNPLIIDDKKYVKTELLDESLALEDMEKNMIRKSLKRHGGRRKEAALELGISERTLYRKIKQYDI